MSRENGFRVWDIENEEYGNGYEVLLRYDGYVISRYALVTFDTDMPVNIIIEWDTGLKDKNGQKIYENCELDGRYRVEYIAPKFVGKDMVKGDIIELYDNKFTITKEHCEISQNSERGTN